MDVSHGQDLRHSLYTTLDGAFPKSIMPIGVEHNLKQKIPKELRKVGWDTLFRPGEEWERTVGGFAIRALDTVYTAYGQNPWFWGWRGQRSSAPPPQTSGRTWPRRWSGVPWRTMPPRAI